VKNRDVSNPRQDGSPVARWVVTARAEIGTNGRDDDQRGGSFRGQLRRVVWRRLLIGDGCEGPNGGRPDGAQDCEAVPLHGHYMLACRSLKAAGNRDHLDPDMNFGVGPDDVLHEYLEGKTPTTAPGATTINTEQLSTMLPKQKPLVIDTMDASWYRSVPGAVGLDFNGNTHGTLTDEVQRRLERKPHTLTVGDMAKPIVAMGFNVARFDGYNLALRVNGKYPTSGSSALAYFPVQASSESPSMLTNSYNRLTQAGVSIRQRRSQARNDELSSFVAFLTDFTSHPGFTYDGHTHKILLQCPLNPHDSRILRWHRTFVRRGVGRRASGRTAR
jgi:hypothetical protein